MRLIHSSSEMQQISLSLKKEGKKIGFVPTMGYLHQGHISLVKESKKKTDITIVSIFVNPTQFAPNEDLNKYPRDMERDNGLLSSEGVDIVFFPSTADMYPPEFQTYVNVEKVTMEFEGAIRPTHFRGVSTVVAKLFNIVLPDYAFFGQKDAQQSVVIKRMVKDLCFPVKIKICPIIREEDGLAMSSRNIYLAGEERTDALVLSKSLTLAESLIYHKGERSCKTIVDAMTELYKNVESAELQYIKIVNEISFKEVENLDAGSKYFVLIACKIGNTRLIDNSHISL